MERNTLGSEQRLSIAERTQESRPFFQDQLHNLSTYAQSRFESQKAQVKEDLHSMISALKGSLRFPKLSTRSPLTRLTLALSIAAYSSPAINSAFAAYENQTTPSTSADRVISLNNQSETARNLEAESATNIEIKNMHFANNELVYGVGKFPDGKYRVIKGSLNANGETVFETKGQIPFEPKHISSSDDGQVVVVGGSSTNQENQLEARIALSKDGWTTYETINAGPGNINELGVTPDKLYAIGFRGIETTQEAWVEVFTINLQTKEIKNSTDSKLKGVKRLRSISTITKTSQNEYKFPAIHPRSNGALEIKSNPDGISLRSLYADDGYYSFIKRYISGTNIIDLSSTNDTYGFAANSEQRFIGTVFLRTNESQMKAIQPRSTLHPLGGPINITEALLDNGKNQLYIATAEQFNSGRNIVTKARIELATGNYEDLTKHTLLSTDGAWIEQTGNSMVDVLHLGKMKKGNKEYLLATLRNREWPDDPSVGPDEPVIREIRIIEKDITGDIFTRPWRLVSTTINDNTTPTGNRGVNNAYLPTIRR